MTNTILSQNYIGSVIKVGMLDWEKKTEYITKDDKNSYMHLQHKKKENKKLF